MFIISFLPLLIVPRVSNAYSRPHAQHVFLASSLPWVSSPLSWEPSQSFSPVRRTGLSLRRRRNDLRNNLKDHTGHIGRRKSGRHSRIPPAQPHPNTSSNTSHIVLVRPSITPFVCNPVFRSQRTDQTRIADPVLLRNPLPLVPPLTGPEPDQPGRPTLRIPTCACQR